MSTTDIASTKTIKDFDIDKPRYNMDTYIGRAKHFFIVTNPLNLFVSDKTLENAKNLVDKQRLKELDDVPENELIKAKVIYESAFHPETGEKQFLLGRMSAQVPVNMVLTACLTFFYKTNSAIIFWQWVNQSFNAVVNFSNRSGDSPITNEQILWSYVSATSSAVIVSLGLKRLLRRAPPVISRFVPFAGCAAANCVNLPMMRSKELLEGTTIYDENGQKIGQSKYAAQKGISQVVFSRVCMPVGGMVGVPALMDILSKRGIHFKYPFPVELSLNGLTLLFSTPMCCAFFKQYQQLPFSDLEQHVQDELIKKFEGKPPAVVYFNKGL